jgi:O-antigen biosynthesis protein
MSKNKNPYLFINGPFSKKSGGNQVVYKLCKEVEKLGYEAFIYPYPYYLKNYFKNSYNCKILDNKILKNFKERKKNPIVVYPENLSGSKIGGSTRVRYYLYFPGKWGGEKNDSDHYRIAFDNVIKKKIKQKCDLTLTVPILNELIFNRKKTKATFKRNKSCYYSEQFEIDGGKVDKEIKKNIKITRHLKPFLSQKKVAKIFKSSKYFYCYLNSGLIWEALLCGCVPVLMKNKYLKKNELIYSEEFKFKGVAIKNNHYNKQKALKEINFANIYYKNIKKKFRFNLRKFIIDTQKISFNTKSNVVEIHKIPDIPNNKIYGIFISIIYLIKIEGFYKTYNLLLKKILIAINNILKFNKKL